MRPSRFASRAAAAALALLLASVPASAELRALLIGIDRYVAKRPLLLGAVNDAVGLSQSLKGRGVTDVTLLTEGAATRAAFETAWSRLVDRAARGDVIMLSFAGHGIRTPETGPVRHTLNGFDKGFVLAPYDEVVAPEELLRDEHLYDLFKGAAAKGVRVVFVADACHSGLGIRGIGSADGLPSREAPFQPASAAQALAPPMPRGAAPLKPRPAIPGVAIFSATEEQFKVKEVSLGPDEASKKPHGALSYAVALGLAGAADASRQGKVTVGELRSYVAPVIRAATSNSQTPELLVPDGDVVLTSGVPVGRPSSLPSLALARLKIEGDSQSDIRGVIETAEARDADLTWNIDKADLRNAAGDRLASGIDASRIQPAIAAFQLLAALRRAMEGQDIPLATRIRAVGAGGALQAPSDRVYAEGTDVRLESDHDALRYFTVLDLAGDGTVHFIYPLTTGRYHDALEWTDSDSFHVEAPITPPFGADFFVFIATARPLTALHAALAAANDTPAAAALYRQLGEALGDQPYQIGIQAAYSCAKPGVDGRCEP